MNRRHFIGSLGAWSLGSASADVLLESASASARARQQEGVLLQAAGAFERASNARTPPRFSMPA